MYLTILMNYINILIQARGMQRTFCSLITESC